jgi:Uma2 family endonuclease
MNATEYRKVPGNRRRISTADFHRMAQAGIFAENERVELINGELVDMTPIGPAHADVVDMIVKNLGRALARGAVGRAHLLRVQNPVRLDDYTEVYPDVALVRQRRYNQAHPGGGDVLLVIEVSDSTLAFDRDVKMPAYAAAGIADAWIANIPQRCLEVYRDARPGERRYLSRQQVHAGAVSVLGQPEIRLGLGELFGASDG